MPPGTFSCSNVRRCGAWALTAQGRATTSWHRPHVRRPRLPEPRDAYRVPPSARAAGLRQIRPSPPSRRGSRSRRRTPPERTPGSRRASGPAHVEAATAQRPLVLGGLLERGIPSSSLEETPGDIGRHPSGDRRQAILRDLFHRLLRVAFGGVEIADSPKCVLEVVPRAGGGVEIAEHKGALRRRAQQFTPVLGSERANRADRSLDADRDELLSRRLRERQRFLGGGGHRLVREPTRVEQPRVPVESGGERVRVSGLASDRDGSFTQRPRLGHVTGIPSRPRPGR